MSHVPLPDAVPGSVVVVGAGGIGSRHLQALARAADRLDVVAVDPSADALRTAQERVHAVSPAAAAAFSFVQSLDQAPRDADVAVVATGAGVRRNVVEALLARGRVRHVVLEKFLFQREVDHLEVGALLDASGATAWVNTPRRLWPGYRSLAARFGEPPVACLVDAPAAAGVGTTAIHFVDLLSFLSGETALALQGEDLQVTGSRHPGVRELTGTVRGRTPQGARFQFTAHRGSRAPLLVSLTWPAGRAVVSEADQRVWLCSETDGWAWTEQEFPTLLQSEMTHRVVADLLATGSCGLPDYRSSAELHLAVLDALAPALVGARTPTTPVPIT